MMEGKIITDHYEFIRRAEPLFEAVERFHGLRVKARDTCNLHHGIVQ
jgi:hypothetical protein